MVASTTAYSATKSVRKVEYLDKHSICLMASTLTEREMSVYGKYSESRLAGCVVCMTGVSMAANLVDQLREC